MTGLPRRVRSALWQTTDATSAVECEVVEHLVVAAFAVIVVDVEEVHPHLRHLVDDEPVVLEGVDGGRLREVGPREETADSLTRRLLLTDLRNLQNSNSLRQMSPVR